MTTAFFFKRGDYMAIATDMEVNWYNTADVNNKIGLSDTLNNLTVNVFDDAEYLVGYTNKALKITKETNGIPHSNTPSDNAPWYLTNGTGYSLNTNNNADGVYYRTILFAVPNDWSFGFTDSIRSNNSQLRIVTKLDLRKNKVYLTTTETVKSQLTLNPAIKVNESIENTSADGTFYIDGGLYYLTAADIYITDNGYYVKFPWLIDHMYRNFNSAYGEGAYYCANYDIDSTYNYSVTCQWFANLDWIIAAGVGNYYNIETWNNTELDVVPDADNEDIKFFAKFYIYAPYYWHCAITYSVEYSILMCACYGMYFEWNGTPLKPIIINGEVTGYTEDMLVQSDIDNWTDISGHNISPTPPPPVPPGPGYDDDPWSGASFSGTAVGGAGAFARCYYMTATELQNLRTWMSGVGVPEGFNPMAQIIGLSQVPVALSGDAPETVQFINSSAVYDPGVVSRVVDSGVSTQYSMGKPISYSLGSIDISRRMQERGEPYLDYSCQIELYLPLIGTFSLDTQAVMGRTIESQAILDPISGTLAAYAWVSRDGQKLPVAYGSTTIGIDLPITAQQYSMSRAAAKQINAQFTASMLSSALTTVTAAAAAGSASSAAAGRSGAASGAGIQSANQFNSYAQSASIAGSQTAISQSGNIFGAFMEWGRAIRQLSYGNNTAIAGSFGGSMAQWSYPFNAYVKIIRPRYEKPSNYNHTQGVPCVQTKRIGDCTGLIQCIGADVSGITRATDLERQAIQAALCNGVYAGGGE